MGFEGGLLVSTFFVLSLAPNSPVDIFIVLGLSLTAEPEFDLSLFSLKKIYIFNIYILFYRKRTEVSYNQIVWLY